MSWNKCMNSLFYDNYGRSKIPPSSGYVDRDSSSQNIHSTFNDKSDNDK